MMIPLKLLIMDMRLTNKARAHGFSSWIPNLPATYLRDYCSNGASYRRLETKAKLKQGLSTNTGTR
ncbi:hypothetical protein EYF80_008984 [Liparis tanakae]|uniref:Uncharacterized protein n=1 Tax=Liparis tanakae TaxID=230148 RepID=A0A4Z2IRV5_9TELE|nr:hypothetical protein EYF80_008984 [Liparis tanakae]